MDYPEKKENLFFSLQILKKGINSCLNTSQVFDSYLEVWMKDQIFDSNLIKFILQFNSMFLLSVDAKKFF